MTAAAKLRALLAEPGKIVVGPGVYDGFTARIALKAGFDCLYMVKTAAMIASLNPNVPLIADADTGYGGPLMVGRTVTHYMRAGVAALHLEDQVQSKRCGHLLNKQLVPEDEFVSRIRSACLARDRDPHGDIVIIARTDALQSEGYEAARDRLRAAIAAGADVAFLEGIESEEQGKQICTELAPTPVLYNCVAGGVSPQLSVEEARALGFSLIVYPGVCLEPVFESVTRAVAVLKKDGAPPKPDPGRKGSLKSVFEVVGLRECMEFDMAAGGALYSKGV
ncbi:hypothetical protein SBRCBS47491_009094 [Sporothrix bragantina]|uniref:Methylisocitrate lyase n=1 Tax=Sporothrix bragantina TaxID=671064 RepID=A0ABP0CRV1_9PEZI